MSRMKCVLADRLQYTLIINNHKCQIKWHLTLFIVGNKTIKVSVNIDMFIL
jgi:hypothetical protein